MKNLSKILVLFLTAFMILGFISCKKDAEESANVVVANVVVAFKADSATIAGNGELILTFYDDGSFEWKQTDGSFKATYTGDITKDGEGKLKFNAGGKDVEYDWKLTGSTLKVGQSGFYVDTFIKL